MYLRFEGRSSESPNQQSFLIDWKSSLNSVNGAEFKSYYSKGGVNTTLESGLSVLRLVCRNIEGVGT